MPMISGGTRRAREQQHHQSSARRSTHREANDPLALPPYEPLSFALTEKAKSDLNKLTQDSSTTRKCDEQIRKSLTLLRKSVAAINDRLQERHLELENLQKKRQQRERSGDVSQSVTSTFSAREERLDQRIPWLEAEVQRLTKEAERGVRGLVDLTAEIEDDKAAIGAMARHYVALPSQRMSYRERRQRRNTRADNADGGEEGAADASQAAAAAAEEEEEEELPPPDRDPVHVLREEREKKAQEYSAMGYYERYGLNNNYIDFKKHWHDARFGESDIPLPDARHWFDEEGNPVEASAEAAGADEDDFVIEGEHQSYKCPLSMMDITQPYSNRKCRHIFQKSVIVEWLNSQGAKATKNVFARCPVSGCDKELNIRDFYDDDVTLRKIERAKRRREREEEEEAEEEDEDHGGEVGDESVVVSKRGQSEKKRVKRERVENVDSD